MIPHHPTTLPPDAPNGDPPAPDATGGEVELFGPPGTHPHPPHPHRRVTGRTRRRLIIGALVAAGLVGVGVGSGLLQGLLPNPVVAGDKKGAAGGTGKPMPVKVVRPKQDPKFRIWNQQLASIEPFYQAGLRARASGVVRSVTKDIGEAVRSGEMLVEIDVPDLVEAVAQKDVVITQRERELALAESDVRVAEAALTAATAAVRSKTADVTRARNTAAARKADYENLLELFKGQPEVKAKVESSRFDHEAAKAAVTGAEVAVEEARAAEAGKQAGVARAQADVDLKRVLVGVARKDRDVTAAQLGYARIHAPFDGVITRRAVDPGVFVQNATSATTEPLITVARVDLVTVVMRLPDTAAAYIGAHTEAVVEFDQLPGVTARGTVTRFSPAINPADRTLRVEVDVYNGTRDRYDRLVARSAGPAAVAPLIPLDGFATLVAAGIGEQRARSYQKGPQDGPALIPDWGGGSGTRRIAPGMTGTMRVYLDEFTDAHLLPAGAVFTQGGQPHILVVENGTTKAVPVVVQVNDGRLVKVAVLVTAGGRKTTRELTGKEVVVATRQQEIGEGQRVQPVFETW